MSSGRPPRSRVAPSRFLRLFFCVRLVGLGRARRLQSPHLLFLTHRNCVLYGFQLGTGPNSHLVWYLISTVRWLVWCSRCETLYDGSQPDAEHVLFRVKRPFATASESILSDSTVLNSSPPGACGGSLQRF